MRPILAAIALLLICVPATAVAQDAKTIIDGATRAMGATGVNAIVLSGEAAYGNFGQSRTISFGLASTGIRGFTRTIDFTRPASRETGQAMPPVVRRGPPVVPRPHDLMSGDSWSEQFEIWITPWGFLRGAAANAATARTRKIDGVTYDVLTWSPPQKAPSGQPYRVIGYINPQQMIERIETWIDHPVMGDMHVEMLFSVFRDFGGLKVPGRWAQRRVGMETFIAEIHNARANPADLAQLMTPAATPAVPPGPAPTPVAAPTAVASEKLADGVYRITGGYVSMAVEFKDHVVVLEGGQSEARGLEVIAETKRLFPGKRIKYVVNTHPHFDHASGLAPFAADGAIVLMDDNSRYFMEQALGTPRTLAGDVLAKSRKKPKVEGVFEMQVLRDETRTLELHHVSGLEHSDAMLIAYLPKERILFSADIGVPASGEPASASLVTLVENIERLRLDFDRHVMVHPPDPDRPMSRSDLLALVKGGR